MYRVGMYFLGGLALGVIGTIAVNKCNVEFKPVATKLISKTMDVKDAVVSKLETIKENVEDVVAEAKASSEKRKNT